ncbi:MAG: LiaF-related protein [Clostridiales bacterium]|nr:LiaF-related protein [Clostridiales bacterium]
MKKNTSNYLIGGIFVLLGIFLAGRATGFINFSIFFDGWWSLFVIVPCFISLFGNNGDKTGSLIGLCIGLLLLLSAQDIIQWRMFGPLCGAAILILVGARMLFPKKQIKYDDVNYKTYENNTNQGSQQNQQNNYQQNYTQNGTSNPSGYSYTYTNQDNSNPFEKNYSNSQQNYQSARQSGGSVACTAVFSGRELHFDNEVFSGAVLSAVLGGIEIDLRNAIIRENVVIEAKAIMGGIDIYVPNYVRVVVNCTPILGGVDNKTVTPMGANEQTITIYLNATCVLGGIDVK